MKRKRSEEHTSELQSRLHLVCRLLLEKKKKQPRMTALLAWRAKLLRVTSGQYTRVSTCFLSALNVTPSSRPFLAFFFFFFFNDPAPTEIYPLPLHAALPIWPRQDARGAAVGLVRTHDGRAHGFVRAR